VDNGNGDMQISLTSTTLSRDARSSTETGQSALSYMHGTVDMRRQWHTGDNHVSAHCTTINRHYITSQILTWP